MDELRQVTDFLSRKIKQLVGYQNAFIATLHGPLTGALGQKGIPGDGAKIINVAREVSKTYSEVLAYRQAIRGHSRIYSQELSASVVTAFEEILVDTVAYLINEASRLAVFFKKFGPDAIPELQNASERLAAGETNIKVSAFTHHHTFSDFDVSKIEALTQLIQHVTTRKTDEENRSGFLYLLVNPSMPGMVKIGHTTRNAEQRLRELSTATGVPTPFEIILDLFVSDSAAAERVTHTLLSQSRVAANREFFHVSTSTAIKAMYRAIAIVNGKDEISL